jgi:dihydroxyacetone kinase
LDEVERVASHANSRTKSLGVAFGGCTVPGQPKPLFEVASGRMDVGLGIHGEPGISEEPLPTAAQLADQFVTALLREAPPEAGRVAVILNGLGRTKYEELFVVWRSVARLLRDEGLTIVEPEVGELVTSLDMEGCSLTLLFLDEELERLWRAPADTPAYSKGSRAEVATVARESRAAVGGSSEATEASTAESRRCAQTVVASLRAIVEVIRAHEEELGHLDSVAGDGDHGRGMVRGVNAALDAATDALVRGAGAGSTLNDAGTEWAARAGGTSGVLWGSALQAFGAVIGDTDQPSGEVLGGAIGAALASMQKLGGARLGDKTMLDALIPFVRTFEDDLGDGAGIPAAWAAAAAKATAAADGTKELRPQVGRARPLAERSIGYPDPGAVSLALVVSAVGGVLASNTGATK